MPFGTIPAAPAADTTSAPSTLAASAGSPALPQLDAVWTDIVERNMAAVKASLAKPDTAFGLFAPIVSLVRSFTYHDGVLLEAGLAHLAQLNPHRMIVPLDRPLPVVPAAIEVIRKNGWKDLSGIQLSSEVHARSTYMPDLLVVDTATSSAVLLDLKRGLSGHSESKLTRLRERMMAAAMITADLLHVEGCAPPVSNVSIAIVDASNEHSDHSKGLFRLSEIDGLIGVAGAGEAMAQLRGMFAARIQAAMEEACRTAVKPVLGQPQAVATLAGLSARDHDRDDDDLFSGPRVPPGSRYSGGLSFVDRNDKRSAWRRVSVGFARAVPD